MSKTSNRLLSLDILRGITIAGMILVNNPGSWSYVYAPLEHSSWNGLTPTDLVFPFFMFIMGISTYISLRKFDFQPSGATLFKILKRTFVIFLIGLILSWLALSIQTFNSLRSDGLTLLDRLFQSAGNFKHLRILGVMQRLAITYGAASLIAVFVKHKYIPWLILIVLIAYFVMLVTGNGFEFSENNILSVFDRAILGVNHMYRDSGIAIDPEGLLSSIPAVCHVLVGFCCGRVLLSTKDNDIRIVRLFIIGAILTFSGFLLSYGCPINKKIWSPTFVLTTCGMASTLLALLIWIIDMKGYKKWCSFFESFGVNPLFVFVFSTLCAIILDFVQIQSRETYISINDYVYQNILQPCLGDYPGSLAYSVLFVLFSWVIGYILYKKRIYIKI